MYKIRQLFNHPMPIPLYPNDILIFYIEQEWYSQFTHISTGRAASFKKVQNTLMIYQVYYLVLNRGTA